MTPHAFLTIELESVRRALKDVLRHEYGLDSEAFYKEFTERIGGLQGELDEAADGHPGAIETASGLIRDLAARISLIERSHLGEFSWPFAFLLRDIGESFDDGRDMRGAIKPLVHVISEGAAYKIIHDTTVGVRTRPIPVVAFPRQLKHQVLLHALFGHEMGHLASRVTGTAGRISREVRPHLQAGALQRPEVANMWLRGGSPRVVKRQLDASSFTVTEPILEGWMVEIVSDLFGLVLFGPAFVAAHRTILEPQNAEPYRISATHPPYAVRRSLLARSLARLTWSQPTMENDTPEGRAEGLFLDFLTKDLFEELDWTRDIISDDDLERALRGLSAICGHHTFKPVEGGDLDRLLGRFRKSLPPIIEDIETINGSEKMKIATLSVAQVLHAGWLYWLGRGHLQSERDLTFEEVNRLCDFALLQNRAISLTEPLRPRRDKPE